MRLVVSAGGTGGHVFPALAVIEALLEASTATDMLAPEPDLEVLWVGSQGGIEREWVERAGIPFVGLAAGGLRGMGPGQMLSNAGRIVGSVRGARSILGDFAPHVILATGGHVCVSVTLAARKLRTPVVLYLPDIVPGLAIRFLSRFAARICVTSAESRSHLPADKVVVTGYPVRSAIIRAERTAARLAIGLDPEGQVLLVLGGSRGARSINKAIIKGLDDLLPVCEVIHISGPLDATWVADAARNLPEARRARYHPFAFLHEMHQALAAADLAVARAGAATLGEFPVAGLPAVVVPYPYSGQHQLPNAEYLVRHGAAQILLDAQLETELVPTVLALLRDRSSLQGMRQAMGSLAHLDASQAIARQLQMAAAGAVRTNLGAET
jgi:UDP-N-acetylglucosamine--N-acetylmuramyl-(pentapeptide) pyrophosphoryl-undecaprenol N-acetylglucosamine transferase